MKLAFVVYPGMTALDVVGPYEVMGNWPGAEVHIVASSLDPVRCDAGLVLQPTATLADVPDPDVVLIGGASNPLGPFGDEALIAWLRAVQPGATWMASVCTGALVYAHAGLLEGRRATTHWATREGLASMGVEMSTDRVVFDPPFVSGAGVAAGIDMALALTARIHGEEAARQAQLAIEYDPEPPFDSGSPEKAGPERVEATLQRLAAAAAADA